MRDHGVLADAGFGDMHVFRAGLAERGPRYVVGIQSAVKVWAPSTGPEPLRHWSADRAPRNLNSGRTFVSRSPLLPPPGGRASPWSTCRWTSPLAQKRFCGAEGIDKALTLSAVHSDCGKTFGLRIVEGSVTVLW